MTAQRPSSIARRPLLPKLALGAALFWWLALIAMALFTANPPMVVSVPQIEQADAVVTGTIPDPNAETVVIERIWKGALKPGKIVVVNLHEVSDPPPEKTWLLALSRFGRHYRLTRPEGQNPATPPLVYPATPEITGQIRRILK